jgi:hypothetical protein
VTKPASYAKSTNIALLSTADSIETATATEQSAGATVAANYSARRSSDAGRFAVPLDHLHLDGTFLRDLFAELNVDPPLVLMAEDDKLKETEF